MNVAFFSSHINKSLQWERLSKGLIDSKEFKEIVHVIFYDFNATAKPSLVSDLEKLNMTVYAIPIKNKWSYFSAVKQSKRILKKHNIQLVHTTLPHGNLFGQIAAYLAGVKHRVNTCENASWAFDHDNFTQKLIDKITFKLSSITVTGSDSSYEYLVSKWKLNPEKMDMIYHGIDENAYRDISIERINKVKESLQLNPKDFIIGMISRLELWKGHEYAIRAMVNIKVKYPNIKLYIFGSEGKDKETIFNLIKELKLEDTVFYKGFINDPIALLQLFDIHIHIPVNKYVENCGISIIEGMISRKPQILTKSGYSFQSAKHLINSYVVDYCNAQEVEVAIETLYLNSQLRQQLADAAYQTAIDEYSMEIKTKKHIELYKKLLRVKD